VNPSGSVPPAIADAVDRGRKATIDPQVVRAGAAGKAYHLVAQAAAIAVQDAADALRNSQTIASAAAGAAITRFLETGDARYLALLRQSRELVENAIRDFAAITAAAAQAVKDFPSD
jgi:hypothetical protein